VGFGGLVCAPPPDPAPRPPELAPPGPLLRAGTPHRRARSLGVFTCFTGSPGAQICWAAGPATVAARRSPIRRSRSDVAPAPGDVCASSANPGESENRRTRPAFFRWRSGGALGPYPGLSQVRGRHHRLVILCQSIVRGARILCLKSGYIGRDLLGVYPLVRHWGSAHFRTSKGRDFALHSTFPKAGRYPNDVEKA
jgi:hypothetical protein